ncbi:MAG: hypothetical protein JWM32_1290, partial [Verrucomicrobia bacterium]|nr:hypothetical protein [Verrucomicrobiota bacterium]
ELDDASLKAPEAFLALINAASGPKYAVSFSSESGATATTGQREQYAFYYNTATVDSIAPSRLYPDPQDEFIREPFAAQFRAKSGPSFVLLTIHTAPAHAPQEIAALGSAVTWAHATYAGEAGIIVLGDFNAGTNYVKQKEIEAIRARDLPYTWIVPDGTATTLAKTPQTHDRIVVTGELARSRTTNWGVDHAFTSETVSDHFPVWAEFDFTNK